MSSSERSRDLDATHRLGMFAKYWQPGAVKTRLAATLGDAKSALIYKAFLKTLIGRFREFPHATLVVSPDRQIAEFHALLEEVRQDRASACQDGLAARQLNWRVVPQGEGDLGQRIERFFVNAFHEGFRSATLLGSDSPSLPLSYVRQSAALLRRFDVVLGPSDDGGYYLVGARHRVPPIFSEINWSTPDVWRQTITHLQSQRIRFAVLPSWYDVDQRDDLDRLLQEIERSASDPVSSPELQRLLDELTMILEAP